MKKEDAIHILTAMKKSYLSLGIPDAEAVEALEMAINAVKAEPCPDTISRDAVYGILMRTYFRDECSYEEFKEMLEQIPPVNPQPKTGTLDKVRAENGSGWIPTAERLPEIGENVLICDIVGDIYLAHRYEYKSNTRFIDYTGDKIKDVKAWMPLPEPYREDGETE